MAKPFSPRLREEYAGEPYCDKIIAIFNLGIDAAFPTDEVRERVAKALYARCPLYEAGESIDGFRVSPGGDLSWAQARSLAAEFGDGYAAHIDECYATADAALNALRAGETP